MKVLAANTGVIVGIHIVSPADNSSIRDILAKEIAEPVDTIRHCPSFVPVSVQTVNGNDAEVDVSRAMAASVGFSSLDDGFDPVGHSLQTIRV
jgi:hypothetical protein